MMFQAPIGQVVWHSSEEDGGPDVGVSLRLAGGVELWVGEITEKTWAEADPDVRALGGSNRWWLAHFAADGCQLIGPVERFAAQDLLDSIAACFRLPRDYAAALKAREIEG